MDAVVGKGTRLTRPLRFLARAARHSVQLARATWPHRFSSRTVILLVMQTLDYSMQLKPKRRLLGRGVGLTTEQDPENPKPDLHPRRRLGGSPRGREARRRGPSSAVPANPGVNPSLTITAMTAYAMSHIPTRAKAESGEDADGLAPAGVRDAGPAGARGGSANGEQAASGHNGASPRPEETPTGAERS